MEGSLGALVACNIALHLHHGEDGSPCLLQEILPVQGSIHVELGEGRLGRAGDQPS